MAEVYRLERFQYATSAHRRMYVAARIPYFWAELDGGPYKEAWTWPFPPGHPKVPAKRPSRAG